MREQIDASMSGESSTSSATSATNASIELSATSGAVVRVSTIHAALRWRPTPGAPFEHTRERPLPTDLVVVDECSMVDLALMRRLVEAVPPEARLVLVGDADQLASVEAGSVFADLCAAPQAVRAVVRLDVRYRVDGGPWEVLDPVFRTAARAYPVAESRAALVPAA